MSARNPLWTAGLAASTTASFSWLLPDGRLNPTRQSDGTILDTLLGTLETSETRDFVEVQLTAGETYIFLSTSTSYTTSLSIYDNFGYLLIYTDGEDIGLSETPRSDTIVNFTASYTGIHKLSVSFEFVPGAFGYYGLGVSQMSPAPTNAPSLAISGGGSVTEGNSGSTGINFTVTRTGDISAASSVAWTAAGLGSNPATAADFTGGSLPTGTISFAANQSTATITLQVAGDTGFEQNEQLRVTLSNPTNGTVTTATADATIVNDDPQPGLNLTGTSGADTMRGGTGDDVLRGGAGNDILVRSAGTDSLFGDAGIDAVIITTGPSSSVGISQGSSKTTISDANGTTVVETVEFLIINNDTVKVLAPVAAAAIPGGAFDETFYRQQNPDVDAAIKAGAFANGKAHFLAYGQFEGRAPNILFDSAYYLAKNPDVAAAVRVGAISAWQHYQNYGWREGRDPSAFFDTSDYLQTHKDVAAVGLNPLDHFLVYGITEGRTIYLSDQAGLLI